MKNVENSIAHKENLYIVFSKTTYAISQIDVQKCSN